METKQVTAAHWSATPVEVDAVLLMVSLLVGIAEGERVVGMRVLELDHHVADADAEQHEPQGADQGRGANEHGQGNSNAQHDQEKADDFGHSGLRLLLDGNRLAAALQQSNQGLPERETRLLGCACGKVAHGRLLAAANRCDVNLPEVAGLKVSDEFLPVHIGKSIGMPVFCQPLFR